MDTASHCDTPVVRTIGGAKVEYPRLDLADLKTISVKLKDQKSKTAESLAEKTRLSAWERFRALQEIENYGVPLGDLLRYGKTPEGIEDFCAIAGKKAGHADDKHAANMKALGPLEMFSLSSELLSTPAAPPDDTKRNAPEEPHPLPPQTPNPS